MTKVYTLPIKCSTVRRITPLLKCIAIVEGIVVYLTSWIVALTPGSFGNLYLDYISAATVTIGTVIWGVLLVIGLVEGWYPSFECIKDE